MAGLAFLPWEKWLARLLHPLVVAIKRRAHEACRKRSLERSEGWPETEGTVQRVGWDSSFPREEIAYFYSTPQGYYSGSTWRWFDSADAREVRPDDKVVLRYNLGDPGESVLVMCVESRSGLDASELGER